MGPLTSPPHRQAWADGAAHAGLPVPEAAENREYEHLFYMLEAAVAGRGIGLSPWIYVANDIAAGRLAAPFGFTPTPARFHLILPGSPPKRGLKAFREWLLEQASTAPAPPRMPDLA